MMKLYFIKGVLSAEKGTNSSVKVKLLNKYYTVMVC